MIDRIVTLPDQSATHQLGIELGQTLAAGSVLLLMGDLGSGKTTLVQGLAEGMKIVEAGLIATQIVSPTFTIINEYFGGRLPLYHLDLYRLTTAQVDDLYLENYWSGVETELGIVAIEWAERLSNLPTHYLRIELTYDQLDGRIASISTINAD
jgi:tRNA threonylcarbamoyladenosine biosynthesis protein TsaE